jgi:hypothetical protein
MRRLVAVVLAALALPALAFMPVGSAAAQTTPQPDGDGGVSPITGLPAPWTLVTNQTGEDIYNTWQNVSGTLGPYCNNMGQVGVDTAAQALLLTTDGKPDGNCARMDSPWTIAPTATDPHVFIEYEATLPTNTWATLWATGYPLSSWPTTGEIDTAEVFETGKACHTYHYGTPSDPQQIGPGVPGRCQPNPGAEAVYGVDWAPGSLVFFINGTEVGCFASSDISADPEGVSVDNKTGGFDPAPGPQSTATIYYVRTWVGASDEYCLQNSGPDAVRRGLNALQ